MGITSYAQNFEDVMLWRALGHIPNGLYIDVGAQHPIVDSVSKAFYEHGWRGIHVEPTTTYANLLRTDRPDEVIIQAALSNHTGTVQFYEIAETGLSTADRTIAANHQAQGFAINETVVPCMTLADVFNLTAEKDIHWLKIDVEGFEKQVLEGWGNASARPWIIVVESTLPLTTIETHENWEALLLERGYQASYFDGLNRYYLSPTHPELQAAFQAGPNVFDNFYLYGKASATFCHLIHEHHKTELSQVQHIAQDEITRLTEALANQQAEFALQGQTLREQLRIANEATRQLEVGLVDQSRVSLEREQALMRDHTHRVESLIQQLQTAQTELHQLSQEGTARERVLALQTAQVRQEVESLLRNIAQRESEFAKELLQTHREADQATAQQTHLYVEQERELQRKLVERDQVLTQQNEVIINLNKHISEIQNINEKNNHDKASLLEKMHAQENDFTNQILTIQKKLNCISEKEKKLRHKLHEDRVLAFKTRKNKIELIEKIKNVEILNKKYETEIAHYKSQIANKQQEIENLLHALALENKNAAHIESELKSQIAICNNLQELQRNENTKYSNLNTLIAEKTKLAIELQVALKISKEKINHQEKILTQIKDLKPWNILSLRAILKNNHPLEKTISSQINRTEEIIATPNEFIEENYKLDSIRDLLAQPNDKFLIYAYKTLLDRLPDPTGLEHYTSILKDYHGKQSIIIQIALSKEAKNIKSKIKGLKYLIFKHKILNILPTKTLFKIIYKSMGTLPFPPKGVRVMTNHQITNPNESIRELLEDHHDEQFIHSVYEYLLNRAPDAIGMKFYVSQLRNGTPKIKIISQIKKSKECRSKKISMPELERRIRIFHINNFPLIGFFSKIFFNSESNSQTDITLRRIENKLHRMNDEINRKFNEIDKSIAVNEQFYTNTLKQYESNKKTIEYKENEYNILEKTEIKESDEKNFATIKTTKNRTREIYLSLKSAQKTN